MKKIVIFFLLILSVSMSSQVGALYISDTQPVYDSEDKVTFIVEMEGSSVLPKFKLIGDNVSSTEIKNAQNYRSSLLRSQKETVDAIGSELSDDIKPRYTYTELFNGFAIDAKYGDMETIKNTEGVKNVYISYERNADYRMSNAPSMTHSLPSQTSGYTGKGQVIAILDNEFDVKHDVFLKIPENPKYTKSDMVSIFSNAKFNASGEVNQIYESDKIPFCYDYGENDSDTFATVSFHGTHVAGIAAGNTHDGSFRGVAPDAQLVLMKISNSEGKLLDASIAAALDDAAKLGVCVINCSYGQDYQAIKTENPVISQLYENAYNAGIFISVAAGNANRGFFGAKSQTVDIDDSASGMPNALDCNITVGSVDNTLVNLNVSEITLSDGSVIDAIPLYTDTASLEPGEYEYCKMGYPSDFEGLDLNGKIAVLDRGVIPFTEKSDNAKVAGAVGIILINNEEDYISSPQLSLPAVCVKVSSGELIKALEVKKIEDVKPFELKMVEMATLISSFSSYGTTEWLGLKPEISAPGGFIYSSLPGDRYGFESGTSMAAPHISGVVAIISQYLDDIGHASGSSERVDLIGNMMMSSADVVYMPLDGYGNKIPYSPRVQGAGMVNTANAINTPVILYSESGKTKLELGDNLSDTLEMSFTAKNLTENTVVYDKISAIALTDGYETQNGINYISGTKQLKSELITGTDSITIPANSSVEVSVQIKLDRDELENYLEIFSNGFHIDGFIRLESTTSETISVGMPFMGFYGNWTKASVFDTTMYDEGGSKLFNGYDNGIGTFLFSVLGDKPYKLGHNVLSDTYNSDAIAISPNADGYYDILGLLLTPMRSIRDLEITIIDEDENILSIKKEEFLSKYLQYEAIIEIPEDISDGSYNLRLEGYMNYDTDNSLKHSISIPIKVDREKSLVKSCKVEGNVVTVELYDYSGIQHLILTDTETGEVYSKSYDSYVTDDKIVYTFAENSAIDLSNIKLQILDNAMNVSTYFLGGFGGKFGTYISGIYYSDEKYALKFDFAGDDELSGASLIIAFYDDKGRLMHTDILNDRAVSTGSVIFKGDFDISAADKCKVFICNGTNTFSPLDTVKEFDMKMYM